MYPYIDSQITGVGVLSMEVQKDIPVRLDLGNLAVFDINRLDEVVKR